MLNIQKKHDGSTLTIFLSGRLDSSTSPLLVTTINESIEQIDYLILDMKDLDYISSAGIRVLISAQKKLSMSKKLVIKNVCEEIQEIFDITGLTDMLNIK